MFENSGSAIRKIASFVCGLGIFLGVVIFFLSMRTADSIPIALLVAFVICLVSYIQGLFLSAFGEMVENNEKIAQSNQKILEELERMTGRRPAADALADEADAALSDGAPSDEPAPEEKPHENAPAAESSPRVKAVPVVRAPAAAARNTESESWCCSCGARNDASAKFCRHCGSRRP